uniref:Uncharacterized protein n=1 Tax=Chromera velia CCMP2878 TaxID=1169474 RepID=A0A0G4FNM6_9ALVE|eukprot:Cvel_17773.t1-p1 / transcript=Cvel_17773.t1 / gene=Cvel_17773 / organism=Chromera_velia_CCMP2878 / gene_product=hypothetical protein / transcript_product=hypothetical protein / location=Cvel_scaffold1437:3630-9906(-) / protein_length=139 / sequence_SO=supercontig / SO=protein_coding / is_pseudo=false
MPSSAFAKYFLPLSHDQRTAYSCFLPVLPLHSSSPPNARACRFQAQKVRKPFDAVAFFLDKDPSPSHSNLSDVSGSSDASSCHSAAQRVGSAYRKKTSSKQLKKVDLTTCPKFAGKKEIVDFASQWGEFSNVHLQRKYF